MQIYEIRLKKQKVLDKNNDLAYKLVQKRAICHHTAQKIKTI